MVIYKQLSSPILLLDVFPSLEDLEDYQLAFYNYDKSLFIY